MTHNTHLKFVGIVEAVDTYGDVWTQRVFESNVLTDPEVWIDWRLTKVPLPAKTKEGHYVSVHRTKAGHWYAVNLSYRMGPRTESQVNRAVAKAKQMRRALGLVA
jgi:hypothetical protein